MRKKIVGILIACFLVVGLGIYTPVLSENRESRSQKTYPEILRPSNFTIDETPDYIPTGGTW